MALVQQILIRWVRIFLIQVKKLKSGIEELKQTTGKKQG
jgi:hypothetical protein